jgi:diguanylate cyclase (GGDEF)-like protein/PAS domain S-box-containing protein
MGNTSYKVLLIEDDIVDQTAFKRLVENEILPYSYSIVDSVSDAKNILSTETFDIIIIDYKLTDGTAFDIINSVTGIPFIIVTGAGDEEIAVKAMKAGASDYLIKDIGRNYLKVLPIVLEKAILNKRKETHFKLLSYAIMSINDSVYFTDMNNEILFVNNAFYKTYGYNEEDILGKHCDILSDNDSARKDKIHNLSETSKGLWSGEIYHKRKDGSVFPIYLSKSIIKDADGKEFGIVGIVRDITDKKAIEMKLELMAHFDDLTGLPNRVLFYDRLNKSLSHAKRNNNTFALLFMDLNKFKKVNDNFGHNAGDILLKMIAKRFSHCLREVDTVARLGGDEFAIILTSINESQNAAFVSQRIIACFEKPFFVRKDIECNIGISIGITVYPSDGHDADTLIKNADVTMYRAKEKGGNSYQFYNSEMNNTVTGNITIENKL